MQIGKQVQKMKQNELLQWLRNFYLGELEQLHAFVTAIPVMQILRVLDKDWNGYHIILGYLSNT